MICTILTIIKVTEHYFPVVLFAMLYKVVRTFDSAGEILKYSNESNRAVLVLIHSNES